MKGQMIYYWLTLQAILLAPVLWWIGKQVRKKVPQLPPACNPKGLSGSGDAGSTPLRVLALGESTVAGLGVKTHEQGLVGALAHELSLITKGPVEWEVLAKSGYTARKVALDLLPLVEDAEWDVVVLGLGGNDLFEWHSPRRWFRDMRELILAMRDQGLSCPIVLTNLPPVSSFPAFPGLLRYFLGKLADVYHQQNQEITRLEAGLFYEGNRMRVEEWEAGGIETNGEPLFSDGVHPSLFTYQLWGKQLALFIKEAQML